MDSWQNPIVKEYIKYMGTDPISAFRKECDYLYTISEQKSSVNNFNSINIDKIASVLDLKNEKYSYVDLHGNKGQLRQNSNSDIKIALDQNVKNSNQYRFIIAHEIGHWIIRTKVSKIFSAEEKILLDKYKYEEELLCHYFASEILMPESAFIHHIKGKKISEKLILKLSSIFKVPDYQIINRIVELQPNKFAIYWRSKYSDSDNKMELRINSIFPNRLIRPLPFIPVNATAKDTRFSPNIFKESFRTGKSITENVEISTLGELKGIFNVFVFNPPKIQSLFEQQKRRFDLISIIDQNS